ncbi:CheY-like superfamily protein [Tanacetum coccineum]
MVSSSENSPMKPNLSIEDSFNPHGLKVLVVDNDPGSLLHLTEMLTSCQYQATTCSLPKEALALIKEDNNKFDIVVTEVHFSSDITGVEFLEIIVRETELPVVKNNHHPGKHIVASRVGWSRLIGLGIKGENKGRPSVDTIMECITKGACICIPKPAKKEVIQFLWQHVARRVLHHKLMKPIVKLEVSEPSSSTSVEDKELCGSSSSDDVKMDDDQTKDKAKKTRMVWTADLDCQFVYAVKHLGIKNAVPKKVLERMNVPGLKREHVASHLQKYRKKLKMLSKNMEQHFIEKNSVSSDAYISVFKNNDSFVSTQPITEVQQEQDFSTQIPSGANSQVIAEVSKWVLICCQAWLNAEGSFWLDAVPKKVLERMNVPGLKREHVASHLQKYRKKLKMLSTNMEQRFIEKSLVSSDAYIPVFKNNDSFVSTQPITEVQQEQDFSTQIPSGANSQVMENNELLIRSSSITELQHLTVQDSSTQVVPNGAY